MTTAPIWIAGIACEVRIPQHSVSSSASTAGQRKVLLSGIMKWGQAQYLSEVCDNAERIQTIANATGVLERIEFSPEGPYLTFVSGWYVLESFDIKVDAQWGGHGIDHFVGFDLACSFLGGGKHAVVVSNSRQLDNDFGRVGVPVVVDPFPNEAADGSGAWLTVDAGGTTVLREYDDTSPMTSMGTKTEPLVDAAAATFYPGLALYPSPTLYPAL